MKASVDFDLWLKGMEMVGVSTKTHYHPLLQIAVKMREEIEQRDKVIEAAKNYINLGRRCQDYNKNKGILKEALSQLEE